MGAEHVCYWTCHNMPPRRMATTVYMFEALIKNVIPADIHSFGCFFGKWVIIQGHTELIC